MRLATPNPDFMQRAIDTAQAGINQGQTPFGACIVREDEVVACVHNVVLATTDITAHAEIHAIRTACRTLGGIDLSGCEIYSTCEPCPMCFSACHWARLERIVFGARIEDARAAGFSELSLSNAQMKTLGGSPVVVVEDFMRAACADLFRRFIERPNRAVY